jgi:hypothetical protein
MTRKILLCVISVVALVCLNGCSRRVTAQRDLDKKLIAAIEEGRNAERPVIVRLRDLTTFDWERFYVFGPYTPPEDVRNALGIDWDPDSTIAFQDWDDLLVFVKGGKVVHYHDHPLNHGDFYGIKRTGYTPDEAVFEVRMETGRLVVRPIQS